MSLNLEDVLNQLNGETEKVASAPAEANASVDLRSAIKEAETALKTASAPADPAVRLEEMANKLASADAELMTKEAQTYGAAMADGFVTRLSAYDDSAATKVASAQMPIEKQAADFAEGVVAGYTSALNGDIVKTAGDADSELATIDPSLVKMASEVIDGFNEGYAEATQGQTKTAASEYDAGFKKTAAAIEASVTDCYKRGFSDCDALLTSVGQG